MAYSTRCTCTEMQLAHVGCECDRTGPVRVVLSYDEQVAAAKAEADALDAADWAAEMEQGPESKWRFLAP